MAISNGKTSSSLYYNGPLTIYTIVLFDICLLILHALMAVLFLFHMVLGLAAACDCGY